MSAHSEHDTQPDQLPLLRIRRPLIDLGIVAVRPWALLDRGPGADDSPSGIFRMRGVEPWCTLGVSTGAPYLYDGTALYTHHQLIASVARLADTCDE